MSWIRRLRNFARSDRHSRELDRELRFHIAERADDLVARGMAPSAAESEARRRFGNYAAQKERARDVDLFAWLASFADDVRYAARSMRHNAGVTLVAVLSLGLGIGANTAIFTLIDSVILRSLPVSHPEELVQVTMDSLGSVFTNPIWEAMRDHQTAFSGVFAYAPNKYSLNTVGEDRPVVGNAVSGNYFATLGLRPALGRLLTVADDQRGCAPVAVIGYGFWQTEYGGNADVIAKTVALNGHPFQIVGVAPEGFSGVDVGQAPQLFVPICSADITAGKSSPLDRRSSWWLSIIGRPAPGMSVAQVNARLASIAPGVFEATTPQNWPTSEQRHYQSGGLHVRPAATGLSNVRRQYGRALYTLMGIVALVLVIACANVANLLLARAAVREREMAVRVAIGASRGRVIRQLLTESAILSVTGTLVGVALAHWATRGLVAFLGSPDNPIALDLTIDLRVLAFSVGVALATGLAFGLAPAWRAAGVPPSGALKSGARGVIDGGASRHFPASRLLVIAQVAVSLTLVVGAGLLVSSFQRLATLDAGFKPADVLIVASNQRGATGDGAQIALDRAVLARLRALPGVAAASLSTITPLSGTSWNEDMIVPGFAAKSEEDGLTWFNEISDGYFATLGTPLVIGRDFNDGDRVSAPRVTIVNETMARHFYGTLNVLGRSFRVKVGKGESPPMTIVGVVKDAKYQNLREDTKPTAYLAVAQDTALGSRIDFMIRGLPGAASMVPPVRAALVQTNPRSSMQFTPFTALIASSLKRERVLATLSGLFGGLALLLAMLGLYGVMSYNVARRRNEIGIRMALGAGQRRVAGMIMREVGLVVAIGLAVGTGLAIGATRLLSSFLFGVRSTDPSTFGSATIVLAAVALVAAYLPARRAARVDPMDALREE